MPAGDQTFVGRVGGRRSLPLATPPPNFAAAQPLPPSRSLSAARTRLPWLFQRVSPGEGSPALGTRTPGALTAIAGSLQGRQLLVGHPALLRGPAPGAPPAASLARQARRLRAPLARSYPASRCPPRAVPGRATGSLAAPSSAPVQPPRADTGAQVNSPSSLPPGCRRLPRQVSFLLQPGPVIQRAGSAPRRSDPYRVWGAAPGPRGPAPPGPGRKWRSGSPGRAPLQLGPRQSWRPGPAAARLMFHFWSVWRVEVNLRGPEPEKPQSPSVLLRRDKQSGSFSSGEMER